MRQEMKYKIRRLVAAFVLVSLFMVFTVSVLIKTDVIGKALDSEFARQDAIRQEHYELWGADK